MHEHTTIPLPHPQLLTEDPFTEVVRQGAGSVLDVECTAIAQCITLCRVYNLAAARRISPPWQGASPAKT